MEKISHFSRTVFSKSNFPVINSGYFCGKIVREKCPSMNVNPFCSPRFRLSVSGSSQQTAFAFGVPDDINGFHPYSVGSVCL